MARADLESEYVRLVLLHEYAHAREWPRVLQPGSPDHGAHWGVEVAAVTRVESGEG